MRRRGRSFSPNHHHRYSCILWICNKCDALSLTLPVEVKVSYVQTVLRVVNLHFELVCWKTIIFWSGEPFHVLSSDIREERGAGGGGASH